MSITFIKHSIIVTGRTLVSDFERTLALQPQFWESSLLAGFYFVDQKKRTSLDLNSVFEQEKDQQESDVLEYLLLTRAAESSVV